MRSFRIARRLLLLLALICGLYVSASADTMVTEREIYDFLTEEMDLPSASACGILANIEHESAFNVNIVGDHGTSYGLCQWHNNRYSALISYCRGIGMDYRTLSGQLQYLKYELETSYINLLATLRVMENTPNGAYKAGYLWCIQFERPADMETRAVSRGTLAKGKYWNRYNSLVVLDVEPQELPPLEEIKVILDREVIMAQPPEIETEPEEVEKEQAKLGLVIEPYSLMRRPLMVTKKEQKQSGDPALGYAAAALFGPLSDGRKERYALPEPEEEEIAA